MIPQANRLKLEDILNMRFPGLRAPMALSPDENWLAATLRGPYDEPLADTTFTATGVSGPLLGSKVLLIHTETGETLEPFPGTSWAPQWSPDGSQLAAYVQHAGHACLSLWDIATRKCVLLRHVPVRPFAEFEAPRWTPDGKNLIVKCVPTAGAKDEESPVTVLRFDPDASATPDETTLDFYTGDLCLVDVRSGNCTVLGPKLDFVSCKISPDGNSVAVQHITKVDMPRFRLYYDLTIFPLNGTTPTTIAQDHNIEWGVTASWSPDGQLLAFSTGTPMEAGRIFVVPADGSSEPKCLTEQLEINCYDEFRPPYWSADGKRIYRKVGKDIWAFSLDGSAPIKHTPAFPENTLYAWLLSPYDDHCIIEEESAVPFIYFRTDTDEEGIATVDLASGEVSEKLVMPSQITGLNSGFGRVTGRDCLSCYDYYQSPTCLLEVWRQDLRKGTAERISSLGTSLQDVDLGNTLNVEWTMPDGKKMSGAVLLPPGYQTETQVPVVVEGYPDCPLSRMLKQGPGKAGLFADPYILVAHGYAVFYPDLTLEGEHIRTQIGAMIDTGVDKLVELGIADPNRLAIVGQSYGGYTTLCAITHTTRFKAAIASAATSDFVRLYGSLNEQGVEFGVGYCETGQAGMGGTVWDKLDRYIEDSPFYHLNKVQTPTLLIAGEKDSFDNDQSKAVFVGLRRLGVPVELRLYAGEQHAPIGWTLRAKRDFYEQVFAWLDRYLQQQNDACEKAE